MKTTNSNHANNDSNDSFIDGCDGIVSILPTSDALYCQSDSPNYEKYYFSLDISRRQPKLSNECSTAIDVTQSIQVGDLIPVEFLSENSFRDTPSGGLDFLFYNREPFIDKRWAIGQALSIFSESTNGIHSFAILVKWYVPFLSPLGEYLLKKEDLNQLKQHYRPQFMLLEQHILTAKISVGGSDDKFRILPGVISLFKLKPPQFTDKTGSTETFTGSGIYEIPFFCKRSVYLPKKVSEVLSDVNTLPSCIRGWDHLARTRDITLFSENSTLRTSMVFHFKEQQQSDNDKVHKISMETVNVGASEKDSSQKVIHNVEGKQNKNQTSMKTEPLTKDDPVPNTFLKLRRSSAHSSTEKIRTQSNLKCMARSSTTRSRKEEGIAENGKRKLKLPPKCRSVSISKHIQDKSRNDALLGEKEDDNYEKFKTKSKPIGEVLYRYEVDESERKPKKTKGCYLEANQSRITLLFYSSVQIQTNWESVSVGGCGLKKSRKHWIFHVGDIVAMACEQSTSEQPVYVMPSISLGSKGQNVVIQKKNKWFPFKDPWSPAQIMAIYQKEKHATSPCSNNCDENCAIERHLVDNGECFVQLRWLYRPNDLSQTCLDSLSKEQRNFLFPKSHGNISDKSIALRSGRNFIEVDHNIMETYAEAALGRVVPIQDDAKNHQSSMSLNAIAGDDGIPQLPITCRFGWFVNFSTNTTKFVSKSSRANSNKKRKATTLHADDQLVQVTGWSNYASSRQGPLSRLLLCPDGYPCIVPGVRQCYESFLRKHFKLADSENLAEKTYNEMDEILSTSQASVSSSWPVDMLVWHDSSSADTVGRKTGELLHRQQLPDGTQREFYLSCPVQLLKKRCDPRAVGKKSITDVSKWNLQVGDTVCIARNGAKPFKRYRDTLNSKNSWYPFIGPWRVAQVLSIYCDRVAYEENNPRIELLLEVRWFHQSLDMESYLLPLMPHDNGIQDELFETDSVEDRIPLSHVLGCVDLHLGRHVEIAHRNSSTASVIPSAMFRCRYFFFSKKKRFQPLFCAGTEPLAWHRSFLERGLSFSLLINQDQMLSRVVQCSFEIGLESDDNFNLCRVFHDMKSVEKGKGNNEECIGRPLKMPKDEFKLVYFVSISLAPSWSEFSNSEVVCAKSERKGLLWTIRVGSFVAVSTASHSDCTSDDSFPFVKPWRPAQILAIFLDTKEDKKQIKVQVRWLYRKHDHCSLNISTSNLGLESVYETDHVNKDSLDLQSVLGPVTLVFGDTDDSIRSAWLKVPSYLPAVLYRYSGMFTISSGTCVLGSSYSHNIERAILMTDHYGEHRHFVLDALMKDLKDSNHFLNQSEVVMNLHSDCPLFSASETLDSDVEPNDVTDSKYAWTTTPPFHTDFSTGYKYFSEVQVKPIISQENNAVWTVRLGDLVALHYEGNCKRKEKALYMVKSEEFARGGDNWPFKVSWAVAEIVTIMVHPDNAGTQSTELPSVGEHRINLEVRWYYRQWEIEGVRLLSKTKDEIHSEEIFETDHYDEVNITCLLAPVDLFDDPVPVRERKIRFGLPVIDFFCQRFFSVHRKCLVPSTDTSGRIKRGRASSPRIAGSASLQASIDRVSSQLNQSNQAPHQDMSLNPALLTWETSFRRVITKLSLTDASKEAYHDSSTLIGRENERIQIESFLRSSIRGDPKDTAKPSIFIAGPPGVGKTASIRAAINKLKHEQSTGRLPEFDFMSLNGMEMRHPFEAYVKLWGDMNEGSCSRVSAEAAASSLESFFSGKKAMAQNAKKRVIVVLLDEIDYLVTQRQTVLYNFFDWPMRSFESGSKHRLIVVGVSNTLNLPERLHPRIQSRIGPKRIFFKSYNVEETVAILKAKIQQASPQYAVFDEDAILFAAKKTAAISGDIRRAFYICRSAATIVMNETLNSTRSGTNPMVRIQDVLKVSRESSNTAHSRTLAVCSPFEVLLLVALASLSKSTGREFGGFDVEELMTKMESTANTYGHPTYLPSPSLEETFTMLSRLSESDLIILDTPRNASFSERAARCGSSGPWPIVSLIIDDQLVLQALKNTDHHELASKYLQSAF